ncbi:MarR family winged helix-turn-helix transcriptional regulator [Ilumatobacter sp.]|uniref:MarR family winged helix-turn-helix transcriptional regulator n=1 Tax=Ilumatobacter sp. TaxID=1967498 RepID=UPI003B5304B4
MDSPSDTTDRETRLWERLVEPRQLTLFGIGMRVRRLNRIRTEHVGDAVAAAGFQVVGDYEVAAALRRSSTPRTPSSLAEDLLVTRAGMSGRLDRLEAMGFVEREPDRVDARSHFVHLTAEGDVAVDAAFKQIVEADRRLFAGINTSEQARLSGLLRKVLAVIDPE